MTVEVGLAKVEDQTSGSSKKVSILFAIYLIDSATGKNVVNINEEVNTVAKTEGVEETYTCTVLFILSVASELKKAELSVRDKVVETGLFVTVDRLEHVPHSVYVEEVLIPLTVLNSGPVTVLKVDTVLDTTVTCAETEGRGKPLTNVNVYCKTADVEVHVAAYSCVNTCTNTDEPVVPEFVRLVRTANYVAVLITVAILLSVGAEGDAEETCYCKSSENSFDTFHNLLQ